MESHRPARRLIVNADDFGRSHSINQAVIRAHCEGILTSASLMVNGGACDEAVDLARRNPTLAVGLHLTLVCGRSTLKPTEIPALVDDHHHFSQRPVLAGLRYFLNVGIRAQLRHEMAAQIKKFESTGLQMDHLNGHLNIHLHPTILSIIRHHSREWGVRHMRLTDDPFRLNSRIAGGNWLYRLSHAAIFGWLSRYAGPTLRRRSIRHTVAVFGLLQNGRVNEDFLTRLLPCLPPGDSELYSHPSLDEFKHEFDALISPRVRALVDQLGIELIRYQDL
jgi:hopanoid biosynthesis associated protein HpnK